MKPPDLSTLAPLPNDAIDLSRLLDLAQHWGSLVHMRLTEICDRLHDWHILDLDEPSSFLFAYPLLMAYVWMIGAVIYFVRAERTRKGHSDWPFEGMSAPKVSILIPCHNEAANIRETIEFLIGQNYPDFEIIAIDDGSTDRTWDILRELAAEHRRVRVVQLATNQGKAVALRTGTLLANSEYLVCIDADALLDPEAARWMVHHFETNPKVGAVTGNPRIRTRSTLLGKIQVGEFSAIVGLIKRAQAAYGRLFTVSGVIAAFRKSALHDVGFWSADMITEDVDISWKLQLGGWQIRFEPRALCWVLMPETLHGLWRQRLRWAQGGAEVLLRYAGRICRRQSCVMWPLAFEFLLSVIWSYWMAGTLMLGVVGLLLPLPPMYQPYVIGGGVTVLLNLTCLAQFALSLAIDARYERGQLGAGKVYYWIIWYPFAYWLLNVFTTSYGLIRAITKEHGQNARWTSLDRGLRHHVPNDAPLDH